MDRTGERPSALDVGVPSRTRKFPISRRWVMSYGGYAEK
jgi:hypothetical protein